MQNQRASNREHGPKPVHKPTRWRTVHIDGRAWRYRIRYSIKIIPPEGFGPPIITDICEVTGRTPNMVERGQWKKTRDGMCTPRHVKTWLQERLANDNDR